VKQRVCLWIIDELELTAVPVQLLSSQANADASQQYGFGEWTGKLEIGRSRSTFATRLHPFSVMSDRAG